MTTRTGTVLSIPPWLGKLAGATQGTMDRVVTGRLVEPLTVMLMLLVGVADYATGVETTFTLLYLFPLAFGTWLRGRSFGVVLALIATACATLTAVFSGFPRQRWAPLIWNQFASLVTTLLVVAILVVLRAYVDRERTGRELAIEQLRHAERLNIIGKLAAGVAHELGTPLSVISGSVEMLETAELNHATVLRYSKSIRDQTQKMTVIIQHLLDFGRRGGSTRMSVDLNDVARRAVDLLLPMAKKRSCTLLVEPSEHSVRVVANPAEIEQVLSNLVVNALQAMSAGGTARVRVSVEAKETADAVFRAFAYVVVQDDGAGIDPRDIPHVFDPFFTTKGVGEGTGLGLSVSYGIVQDHGGRIEVSSERGKGAQFGVLLPLASSRNWPTRPLA
jgi:signal transduction histidine kinase